ncbi:MAG: oligosaccharide flippase family protein [Methanolinea sp.]|nr:oligosaccharide flippase family protein [Methanolinea sp.]
MAIYFFEKLKSDFSQYTFSALAFLYQKIFREKIDDEIKKFIKNLSYVGFGTIFSTLFSFLFNILAGRILGPGGYGQFILVQSIGMMLYIPMMLGFNTAMIKYCAENRDDDQLKRIISTTFFLIFTLIILSVMVYGLFVNLLIAFFSVNMKIIWFSIIFAVLFVLFTLVTSTLRGLHQMEKFALFQSLFGIVLLLSFLAFLFVQFVTFEAMVYAYYIAYGVIFCVIVSISLKKYLSFQVDRIWLSKVWKYSGYALIGGLSFTLYTNIDRILINYYMDIGSVGIYGVYYYASFAVIGLFSGIFVTVFFPTASKVINKELLYIKLKKLIPLLFIIGIPGTMVSEFVILRFFGKEYPVDLSLMFIFALTAVLVTTYTIFAWFFNAEGMLGARLTVSGTMIIAIVNVIFNILFIPIFGLYGAIGATLIAFILGLWYNYYFGKKIFEQAFGLSRVNHHEKN